MRTIIAISVTLVVLTTARTGVPEASATEQRSPASQPKSVRMYVFDGGSLDVADPGRYQLKREEVDADKFSVACFLIVHPRGVLMWDACAVPDGAWKPTGTPVRHHLVLPGSQERY